MLLLENNMLLFHFYPIVVYAMETLISVHSRLQKTCYHYKAFQIGFIRKLFFVGKEDVSPKVKGFVFA